MPRKRSEAAAKPPATKSDVVQTIVGDDVFDSGEEKAFEINRAVNDLGKKKSHGEQVRATSEALNSLIQNSPSQGGKRKLPYNGELPKPSRGLDKIVDKLFADDFDPAEEGAAIMAALKIDGALTPGTMEKAANVADEIAVRAHRLYLVARTDFEQFQIKYEAIADAMRTEATSQLQAEKNANMRSKAITEADVRGRCALLYPDEWAEAENAKNRYQATVDHWKFVAEQAAGRRYSLGQMQGRRVG
jgi:hypothetical protein